MVDDLGDFFECETRLQAHFREGSKWRQISDYSGDKRCRVFKDLICQVLLLKHKKCLVGFYFDRVAFGHCLPLSYEFILLKDVFLSDCERDPLVYSEDCRFKLVETFKKVFQILS